jgi:hypothetical protein
MKAAGLESSMTGLKHEWKGSEDPLEQERLRAELFRATSENFPIVNVVGYIPLPKHASSGLLAAQELIPVAQYDATEDHEFLARGATLAILSNEGMTYHKGNAAIRVSNRSTQPQQKHITPRRMERAWKRLFGKKDRPHRSINKKEGPTARHTNEAFEGPRMLTNKKSTSVKSSMECGVGEMEPKYEEVRLGPEVRDWEERTNFEPYQIFGPEHTSPPVARSPDANDLDKNNMWESEIEDVRQDAGNDEVEKKYCGVLTVKGSDPPASDWRLFRDQGRQTEKGATSPQVDERLKEVDENYENLESSSPELRDNHSPSIKGMETTDGEPRPQNPETVPIRYKHNQPPCRRQMDLPPLYPPRPPLERQSSTTAARNPVHLRPSLPGSIPSSYTNAPGDLGSVPRPQGDNLKPGILVATHLLPVQPPDSTLPGPFFVGYGTTLAVEGPDGVPATFHGRSLIHMYPYSAENSGELMHPPPPGEFERMRTLFFQQQGALPYFQQIATAAEFPTPTVDRRLIQSTLPTRDPRRLPRSSVQQFWTADTTPKVSGVGFRTPTPFAFKKTAPRRDVSLPPIATLDPKDQEPGKFSTSNFHAQRNEGIAGPGSDEPRDKGVEARPSTPEVQKDHDEELTESIPPQSTQVDAHSSEAIGTEASQDTGQPIDDALLAQSVSLASDVSPEGKSSPSPDPKPSTIRPEDSGTTTGGWGEPDVHSNTPPFFEKNDVLPSIHYQNWKAAEAMIAVMLEQTGSWKEEGIRDIFDNLGIPSWWKVLNHHETQGLPIEWEPWKDRVTNEVTRRGNPGAGALARLIFADLEKLDEKKKAADGNRRKYVQSVRIADHNSSHHAPGETPYYQPISKKKDPRFKFPIKRDQWRAMKTRIRNHLVQGMDWNDPWIEGSFQLAELKEWWDIIVKAKNSEGKVEWTGVKEEVREEWHKRYPRTPAQTFVWLIEELEEVEKTALATRALKSKLTDIAQDIDMKEDAPRSEGTNPDPPPLFYPTTPSPIEPSIPTEFDPQEFELVKFKIKELEERVAAVMEEVKEKLKAAEEHAHAAMITLVELKWRLAQARGGEAKEAMGRKENKKDVSRRGIPTHPYPTRYAEARFEEILQISLKEYRTIEERVRRSEEKVEATAREMGAIEEELAKFEALQSQVVTLSQNFENFRLAQVKINLSMIANYARLRTEVAGIIEPALVVQGRTILDLQTRFNALTALAANFFGEQQMVSVLDPAKVPTTTFHFDASTSNSIEPTSEPFTV